MDEPGPCQLQRSGAATDGTRSFEDKDLLAGYRQSCRGGESIRSGPDDDRIRPSQCLFAFELGFPLFHERGRRLEQVV